jgi:hypothetical protein
VLLEVLAAVAVLAAAGLALVELTSAGAGAVSGARAREAVLWDEERLLAAHTLLARAELDQRLGRHEVGLYVVHVQRPEPALYRIAVGRREAPEIEDLVTVVVRPEARDAR